MKKFLGVIILSTLLLAIPKYALAASGIFPSGGGSKSIGESFTVTVTASGGEFNAFQGKISVSGPVSVTSFSAGSANWITAPSNGGTFSGALLGQKSTSLTIATIKLKGTSAGSGAVTVSNVVLKNGTTTVSTSGGSASFTIQKAADLPGSVSVSSSTHPDQNQSYEATTVSLSWAKASNVTGFSYLLDQTANTTPPSTATNANTSVTYQDKAVGTYYFHIKAQSADGWGPVTHFKVTIKEPDPKINASLEKPSIIKVNLSNNTVNDIAKGTFSGIVISGVTASNYTANITLSPTITLPEGKTLTAKADADGKFELVLDFPINAGHYSMTVQGQDGKVLTPISDPVYFEISQAKGGAINILTESDNQKPVVTEATKPAVKWYDKIDFRLASGILAGLLLLSIIGLAIIIVKNKKDRNLIKHLKSFK